MISCSSGLELVCGEGLAFDYTSQQCKPADALNCITATTSTLAPTSSSITTIPTKVTTTTPNELNILYRVCSPFTGKMFFPHPTDCSKLIKCERVENTDFYDEIIQTCPGGTLFNPDLQVCDWAHNVVCKTYTYVTELKTTTTAVPALPGKKIL